MASIAAMVKRSAFATMEAGNVFEGRFLAAFSWGGRQLLACEAAQWADSLGVFP